MSIASPDIDQLVHERWLEFTRTFGNEGFFEEGVIGSMMSISKICEIFFGDVHASAGLNRMVRGAFPHRSEEENWEDILEDEFSMIFSETAIGHLLHDLTAYADFGIVLATARDSRQREEFLSKQIGAAKTLLRVLPVKQWGLDGEHLVKLLRKAIARWKVDTGQHVDAKELALLSGRALQTIKNKLAGKPAEIIGNQNRIEAREAAAWLAAQKDFNTSIWRDQDDTADLVETDRGLGEVLFLPVAKDGSVFHPGVRREGKYLVDEEGREREIEAFEEALASLQSMVFPQWRRPTAEGVWTRVRAVEWRRYSADEVTRLAGPSPGET